MPELPDIEVYREALADRLEGERLSGVRLQSSFLLRTVEPPLGAFEGLVCTGIERLGKRLVFAFEGHDAGELFLVLHLMIAGRLRWREAQAKVPARNGLAAFDWDAGSLILTEAGRKKRASLHAVQGRAALTDHRREGLDVRRIDRSEFQQRLQSKGHTLKRALCDPAILDGIGNAYSDEILHRAGLSPLQRATNLKDPEVARLFDAAREVLEEWTARLAAKAQGRFPEQVTAFHPEMAVHGKYREPCPVCSAPIQRIIRQQNEINYCPGCQTDGRILKDRVLSQLLKDDWPRSLDELL